MCISMDDMIKEHDNFFWLFLILRFFCCQQVSTFFHAFLLLHILQNTYSSKRKQVIMFRKRVAILNSQLLIQNRQLLLHTRNQFGFQELEFFRLILFINFLPFVTTRLSISIMLP